MIRALPRHQRPRERLLRGDGPMLTDAELLAVLIGCGTRHGDVLSVCGELLKSIGSFREISRSDPEKLHSVKGIGSVKASRILAALEIGRRFREQRIYTESVWIRSAQDVAHIFMPKMRDLGKEVFFCVFLDSKNKVLSVKEMAEGTPNSAFPVIRTIVSEALKVHAVSILCMHNHPSGDPSPSHEDICFTQELFSSVKHLDLGLLDHIIFGDDIYYSFKDKRLLGKCVDKDMGK